jgi:hypothetical protein
MTKELGATMYVNEDDREEGSEWYMYGNEARAQSAQIAYGVAG